MQQEKVHIWVFCGYAGSGKTAAAKLLQAQLDPRTTYTIAFADAVKDDVAVLYNLPRPMFDTQEGKASLVKTPDGERTARELLIDYSLAMKEAHGYDVWAKEVARNIHNKLENCAINNVIIHDWRFIAEIETMIREFPKPEFVLHTIRIVRPSIQCMQIPSEHEIDTYSAEITLLNNGTIDDLNEKICKILIQSII
jgi:dephospho-CoA kinase